MTDTVVDLFYSYAHEDEPLREELEAHLRILERRGVLRSWHDRHIGAGQDWAGEISAALEQADLILFLVSSDFIDSDYCWGLEMQRALARHDAGEAVAIPVIVRDVLWEDAPFARIQGLPEGMKPVTSWPDRDAAWTSVARGVRAVVQRLGTTAPAPAPAAAPALPRSAPSPSEAPGATRGRTLSPAFTDSRLPGKDDGTMTRVQARFADRLAAAEAARGEPPSPAGRAGAMVEALLALPDPGRVLWADDQPGNNAREIAALHAMQIEVECVTSTQAALDALSRGGVALLVTDWTRPGVSGRAEGLRLLEAVRARHPGLPSIVYCGVLDAGEAATRRAEATAAGARGLTWRPGELIELVARHLRSADA